MNKKRLRYACLRTVSAFIDATNLLAFLGVVIYAGQFVRAGFI